jgi:hypothetical protein
MQALEANRVLLGVCGKSGPLVTRNGQQEQFGLEARMDQNDVQDCPKDFLKMSPSSRRPENDSSEAVAVSRRNIGALLGALGGAAGLAALAACEAKAGASESTATEGENLTGSGAISGPLTLAGPPLSQGATILTVAQPAAPGVLQGRMWIAIDPYTNYCDLVAVTAVQGKQISFSPATAHTHEPGALIVPIEEGIVTPQLFGYVRGADATAPINAAIAALQRLTSGTDVGGACTYDAATGYCEAGGTLYLPRGTYRTTGTITVTQNIEVRGAGISSVIAYEGTGTAIVWQPTLYQAGLCGVLASLQVRSEKASSQIGIQIVNGYVAAIRDVHVTSEYGIGGFQTCGISIVSTAAGNSGIINVECCNVTGISGDGVQVDAVTSGNYIVSIRGSHIQGNRGWGINVNGGTTGTINPSQVHIDGNDLEGNGRAGPNGTFVGGGITGAFYAGSITNNYWEEGRPLPFLQIWEGPPFPQAGGTLQAVYGLEIANNVIHQGVGGTPYQAAMVITPSSGGLAVSVHNNYFGMIGGTAAIQMGGVRQSSVRDNWVNLYAPLLVSDYYSSNDYNLKLRTYRFLLKAQNAVPGRGLMPIATEGGFAGNNYVMPEGGYVLAVTAYTQSATCATGGGLQAQAMVNGAVRIDTTMSCQYPSTVFTQGLNLPGNASTQPFPQYASLTANVATDVAYASGDILVEILVGFGTPGGGVT